MSQIQVPTVIKFAREFEYTSNKESCIQVSEKYINKYIGLINKSWRGSEKEMASTGSITLYKQILTTIPRATVRDVFKDEYIQKFGINSDEQIAMISGDVI